jgi:hypothetical protein
MELKENGKDVIIQDIKFVQNTIFMTGVYKADETNWNLIFYRFAYNERDKHKSIVKLEEDVNVFRRLNGIRKKFIPNVMTGDGNLEDKFEITISNLEMTNVTSLKPEHESLKIRIVVNQIRKNSKNKKPYSGLLWILDYSFSNAASLKEYFRNLTIFKSSVVHK